MEAVVQAITVIRISKVLDFTCKIFIGRCCCKSSKDVEMLELRDHPIALKTKTFAGLKPSDVTSA